MGIEYAIIVKHKTRLELLIERFNTKAQARFYIERSGGNFDDYAQEDEQFHTALSQVQRELSSVLKNKTVERAFLPSFLFNDKQVVVVVGQDGLVANTAKYVNALPIVAVNPDAARYDGVLLPFTAQNFMRGVENVLANKHTAKIATLAEATLQDGQRLLAFNDLFIGAASHISARYKISYNRKYEEQSSSGIIVSTQAGATGWLSSIFNMTANMQQFVGETDATLPKTAPIGNDQLLFVVREPFKSKKTQTNLAVGIITAKKKTDSRVFYAQ